MKYPDVLSLYQSKRGRDNGAPVTVGNNRTLRKLGDGTLVIALHGHDLLQYKTDGRYFARDAGYVTSTTYKVLNEFKPDGYTIYRRGGVGKIITPHGGTAEVSNTDMVEI